ncbi:MAG: DeoR family transcriptional regulator [Flexilinea sp.]
MIQIVNANGSIRAVEIAKILGVTSETIRKDLLYLNEQELLKKEFGGAVADNEFIKLHVDKRTLEN